MQGRPVEKTLKSVTVEKGACRQSRPGQGEVTLYRFHVLLRPARVQWKCRGLVCYINSAGLDVPDVSLVVNYSLGLSAPWFCRLIVGHGVKSEALSCAFPPL